MIYYHPLVFVNINPYIDPGTGMLIIQFVIAGVIGGLVFLRNYIKKLVTFLMSWRKKK